jgi:hypothetical protein
VAGGDDLAPGAVALLDVDAEIGGEPRPDPGIVLGGAQQRDLLPGRLPWRDDPGALALEQVLVQPALRSVGVADLAPGVELRMTSTGVPAFT